MTRLHTRLRRLEVQLCEDCPGRGLAALLAYAQRHGLPDDDEALDEAQLAETGLGRLLLEARQVREAEGR